MPARVLPTLLCCVLIALGCGAQELPALPENSVSANATSADADPTTIMAAKVGDETISLAELDEWIRNDLFDRAWDSESELFALRSESLERMASRRILEQASSARNLSIEQFVLAEVDAQGEISDEEVAALYEEQKDGLEESLEDLTPRIREFLRRRRGTQFVQNLIAEKNYTLLLEQPRIEMAADGPSRGPDDAAVTMIEFSDFQCPYCSRAIPVIDELLERYPNDLRIVYRQLPLGMHSRARPAAEASLCADEQGKFWPYHDLVFANSKTLADEDLKRFASEAGLDVAAFDACVAEGRFKQQVQQDVDAAYEVGITSTPAFLVNGILVGGAKPADHFAEIIDAELAKSGAGGDES